MLDPNPFWLDLLMEEQEIERLRRKEDGGRKRDEEEEEEKLNEMDREFLDPLTNLEDGSFRPKVWMVVKTKKKKKGLINRVRHYPEGVTASVLEEIEEYPFDTEMTQELEELEMSIAQDLLASDYQSRISDLEGDSYVDEEYGEEEEGDYEEGGVDGGMGDETSTLVTRDHLFEGADTASAVYQIYNLDSKNDMLMILCYLIGG